MVKDIRQGLPRLPDIGEAKRGPGGYLTYLLRQANAAVRLALDRALAAEAVTYPQHSVLTIIRAYDEISAADLARLTLLTPQTVNGIVQTLETRGAIRRAPHPVHGRILRLAATEQGRALNKRCRTLTKPVEDTLRSALNPSIEGAVRAWLVEVAKTLGARPHSSHGRNRKAKQR